MTDKHSYSKILVLTPDPARLKPQVLPRPFILYALPSYPTDVNGVIPLPNVLELLGGPSGGGGPPGFSALQHLSSVKEPHILLIAGFLAGNEVRMDSEHFFVSRVIGAVASAAVVVTYLSLGIPDPGEDPDDPDVYTAEGLEEFIRRAGYEPIPLIEYETPQMILDAIKAQPGPVNVPK